MLVRPLSRDSAVAGSSPGQNYLSLFPAQCGRRCLSLQASAGSSSLPRPAGRWRHRSSKRSRVSSCRLGKCRPCKTYGTDRRSDISSAEIQWDASFRHFARGLTIKMMSTQSHFSFYTSSFQKRP